MSCRNTPKMLRKTSEAAVATNELRPLKQNVPMMEVTHMPFEHEYGDSAPFFNPEQFANGGAV